MTRLVRKGSTYDRRLLGELLALLLVFGIGLLTGGLNLNEVAVAAEALATSTSGSDSLAAQGPKFFLFGEELCKDIKPAGATKLTLCIQQYRNDNDPKKCIWIGALDYSPPNQVHGQVTGLVQYEENGKPLCLGNQSDVEPNFVAHGKEFSINSGPPKGTYFMVENTKDNCLWLAQRDPEDSSRVISLSPYKENGRTVCE